MLPRVSVPNTESRTTCFVLHHTHIFSVIFQASKPNPATYILHKIFAISLVSVSVRRRRPVEVLLLFTSLRNSTCSIRMLLRVKSTRRTVCCESLPLSFRDSFDVFDMKTLLHFSVSSTLSALSLQGGFVFWEMLSSGTHRFSQFPWCLLLFCFLFCFFFSPDVLEGTTLMVSRGFDDSQLGASTGRGPAKKGGPKVGIDLFVPIFSVLHRWCLCRCWCPLKSKGFKEHSWYFWRRRWLTASIISQSQCNPVLVVPFTMLL